MPVELNGIKGATPEYQPHSIEDVQMEPFSPAIDSVITPEGFTAQSFTDKTRNNRNYTASAQDPLVLDPPNLAETANPKPHGAAEQEILMKFYTSELKRLIKGSGVNSVDAETLFIALNSGNLPSEERLLETGKKIIQEAEANTREAGHLSSEWTIGSTSSKEWTPVEVKPYDQKKQEEITQFFDQKVKIAVEEYIVENPSLNEEARQALRQAADKGNVASSIAEKFVFLTNQATEATQSAFNLPPSWFKGTEKVEDWKPIETGVINSKAVSEAQADLIFSNVIDIMEGYLSSLKKTEETTSVPMTNFITYITKSIAALKQIKREMNIADADKSREIGGSKIESQEARHARIEESIKKREELREKQKSAETFGLAMKIIGPIIAALSTIVGAVLSVVTFGASTAIIIAGIAVGAALTAYSIIDSATGSTQKLMGAINDWLANMEGLKDNPVLQKIVKATIVAVIVVVLVVAIVATGGGAGANLAAQTTSQVVRAAIMESIKLLSIQLIVMTVLSSNVLPELVGEILKKNGVDKSTSQICEIVTMAIVMLTVMVAIAAGSKAAGAPLKGLTNGAANSASGVQNAASKTLSESIKDALKSSMDKVKELLDEALKSLKAIPGSVSKSAKDLANAIKSPLETLKDVLKSAVKSDTLAGSFKKTLDLTGQGLNVAEGITRGVMGLQVANLLKEVGENKKAEELLQAIIDMLEKLLMSLQQGMDSSSKELSNLNQVFNQLYQIQSGMASDITRSMRI